jgi:polyisoprenoid-binding protein YceI
MNFVSYLLLAGLLFMSLKPQAQQLKPVDEGSTVKFVISNLGFDATGTFKGLAGTIRFDEKNLAASAMDVTVNTSTIDTNNGTRDKHLRGSDYFAVETYPQIRLVSVKIAKSVTPGYYVLFARLTIKETTKEISFPFTASPEEGGYRFKGVFSIKRRDFGVGGKNTISNDLKVNLDILTKK